MLHAQGSWISLDGHNFVQDVLIEIDLVLRTLAQFCSSQEILRRTLWIDVLLFQTSPDRVPGLLLRGRQFGPTRVGIWIDLKFTHLIISTVDAI